MWGCLYGAGGSACIVCGVGGGVYMLSGVFELTSCTQNRLQRLAAILLLCKVGRVI